MGISGLVGHYTSQNSQLVRLLASFSPHRPTRWYSRTTRTSQQRGHFPVTMICPCCGTKVWDDISNRVLHQTIVHQRVCIGGRGEFSWKPLTKYWRHGILYLALSGTEFLIWKSINLGISIILCRSSLIKHVHIRVCVYHNTGFHNTSSNILLVIPSHLLPFPYISPVPYPLRFSPSSAPAPGFLDLTVTSS